MYEYVEGDLVSKTPTQAVLAVGGVGYRLTIPLSTYDSLPASGHVRLFAHLLVREDLQRLYGFATQEERRLFLKLMDVQGVGPGTAMAVLSGMPPAEFREAVAGEDLDRLMRIKGIGRKTAERIVVELKREMERELLAEPSGVSGVSRLASDAVAAMLALGYTRSSSETAVRRALDKVSREASLEQLVREALQQV